MYYTNHIILPFLSLMCRENRMKKRAKSFSMHHWNRSDTTFGMNLEFVQTNSVSRWMKINLLMAIHGNMLPICTWCIFTIYDYVRIYISQRCILNENNRHSDVWYSYDDDITVENSNYVDYSQEMKLHNANFGLLHTSRVDSVVNLYMI